MRVCACVGIYVREVLGVRLIARTIEERRNCERKGQRERERKRERENRKEGGKKRATGGWISARVTANAGEGVSAREVAVLQ